MSLIHPLAYVDSTAEVGEGTRVGPFAYVGPGVTVGKDNDIATHAVIDGPGTTVGDRNLFSPNAVIGGPPQDKKYHGEPTFLTIGDDNQFRENVTVNRGTGSGGGRTVIGNDNLLLAGAHVAHDCQVGDKVILSNNVLLAGHVAVADHAIMNGACAIHHFGTVGELAYIGGLTRLVHDAPPFMVIEGHPARVKKVNKVGLERHGVPPERVELLQRAFRYLFSRKRKGIPLSERFQLLDAEGITSPEVVQLRNFLVAQAEGRNGRALEKYR